MKVITLSEVASRLRQRRQGRGYLGKFIEECTIEDAIPLDKVKQAREEIENLRLHKAKFITNDNKVCIDSEVVIKILDKLIESEEK